MGATKIQKQDLDMDGLASAINSLIEQGVISMSAIKSIKHYKTVATSSSGDTSDSSISDYAFYADITISSVDTTKAVIIPAGVFRTGSVTSDIVYRFINSTKVRAIHYASSGVTNEFLFTVVEFA